MIMRRWLGLRGCAVDNVVFKGSYDDVLHNLLHGIVDTEVVGDTSTFPPSDRRCIIYYQHSIAYLMDQAQLYTTYHYIKPVPTEIILLAKLSHVGGFYVRGRSIKQRDRR